MENRKLTICGCGAVGSEFVAELSRRLFGTTMAVHLYLIDDGLVEERNLPTQQFIQADLGKPKAVVLAERYSRGNFICEPIVERITADNAFDLLLDKPKLYESVNNIIVDGLDNVQSRLDVWDTAFQTSTPILHMALEWSNLGYVNWSKGTEDTFHLSRLQVTPKHLTEFIEAPQAESLPPCQLVAFRQLISMVGFAGVQSYMAFCNQDDIGFFTTQRGAAVEREEMISVNVSPIGYEVLEKVLAV